MSQSNETQHSKPQNALVSLTTLVIVFVLTCLLIFTLSRLSLVLLNFGRYIDSDYGRTLLWVGLRFDLVVLAYILLPIMLLTPLASVSNYIQNSARILTVLWLITWVTLILLLEAMTPIFAENYDARPNFHFIEYLRHLTEIMVSLWDDFRLTVIVVTLLVMVVLMIGLYIIVNRVYTRHSAPTVKSAVLYCLIGVFICVAFARSSFDHNDPAPV